MPPAPQEQSGDLATYTGYLLRRAQQAHVAAWQKYVSDEISSVQFGLLSILRRTPGASQRMLCDELDLDRSTVADVAARLERRGLIERVRDATDRRRNVLELTADGQAALDELTPRVVTMNETLTNALAPQEIGRLRELLTRIIEP
ncbi:MarR family winged helix-turn-helix transcriptional regulator [Subtercola lobariae]|uniref:Transcriptional regulator n=1 Tax=Subtercola lobariae TaxID=1588641 RepID=A0A917BFF0_9MICO|nr:MarR family winged helix-turn-helix transcriptional regulator [Subtercola lobariae]GGF38174.1 transcriptional regulator [Subtercola lobariae]